MNDKFPKAVSVFAVHSASVTEQYSLVLAKGVISLAGKVTEGLVESYGSLPLGLWLMSPAKVVSAKKPGSQPNTRNRVWDYFTFLV